MAVVAPATVPLLLRPRLERTQHRPPRQLTDPARIRARSGTCQNAHGVPVAWLATMRLSARQRLGIHLTALAAGHLTMLALRFALSEISEPVPNGFRFDSAAEFGSFVVLTLAPIVAGLAARCLAAAAVASFPQALSALPPHASMRVPGSNPNFAVLLWMFLLLAAAASIGIVDRSIGTTTRMGAGSQATLGRGQWLSPASKPSSGISRRAILETWSCG